MTRVAELQMGNLKGPLRGKTEGEWGEIEVDALFVLFDTHVGWRQS